MTKKKPKLRPVSWRSISATCI